MELTPFFGRVGSKRSLKKKIYKLIPEFKYYVEPFVGGGAVFLGLKTDKPIIINDIDEELMSGYEILKKGIKGDFNKYNSRELSQLSDWRYCEPKNDLEKLVKLIILTCNTFASKASGKVYKKTSPHKKLLKAHKYTEKLKNTIIRKGDYKNIINTFDSTETFFYFDPPYRNCRQLYKHEKFDFEELNNILKTIKGKFLLSLDGSEENFKTFKTFNIIDAGMAGGTGNRDISIKKRQELFITNYKLN